MGKPVRWEHRIQLAEYIGEYEQTRGSEPSQYPEGKEINRDSGSSGERNRTSPNLGSLNQGVVGPATVGLPIRRLGEGAGKLRHRA
jgi:hypothetical protein